MREDLHTEFKREWKIEHLRNIAAFANTDGGVLHIGIDDDGNVFGVNALDKNLKQIPDDIQNGLGIVPTVDHYVKDGKDCISITVKKSSDPVFYASKLWVKSGSTTRALSGHELRDKILKSSNLSWTDLTADSVDISDLSKDAVLFFLKASKKISPDVNEISDSEVENVLLNLGMIDAEGRISRSAAILFCPEPSKYVLDAYLKIGEFDDRGELLREQYVKCPMIMMPDTASEIIFDKFVPGHFDYSQMQRKMVYKYPPEAVREILINAVIHNDYSIGWPIEVRVYRNKMSVFNYGELPDGWDIETLLKEHPSTPRNRRLAETFHEAGFIEKWGKGIRMVLDLCAEKNLPEPLFEEYFKGLRVTFRENGEGTNNAVNLTERESLVLDLIRRGEFTTIAEAARILSMTDFKVESTLNSLKDKGKIHRVGSKKIGFWEIL